MTTSALMAVSCILRCLKLYCECFASGSFCDPQACHCVGCCNNAEHAAIRKRAIEVGPKRITKIIIIIIIIIVIVVVVVVVVIVVIIMQRGDSDNSALSPTHALPTI